MASHTITAMFKSRAEAQSAIEALQRDVGITSVRVLPENDMSSAGTTPTAESDKGFFASLRDLFVPDEERDTYAEGVRRGDVLVTASVEESKATRVMDLLEQHGAVDLEAQERTWRDNGWLPPSGGATNIGVTTAGTTNVGPTAGARAATATQAATMPVGTLPKTGAAAATTHAAMAGRAGNSDETIQLVEERLVVGKRDVSHGRVKVRSYVVETPVSEQVKLRDEHVSIERRPVDRAATAGEDLFRERTIEATEHGEEAVISKETRVREEVVLHKDVQERTQTLTDKVRRTEIEVEGGDKAKVGVTATTVGTQPVRR